MLTFFSPLRIVSRSLKSSNFSRLSFDIGPLYYFFPSTHHALLSSDFFILKYFFLSVFKCHLSDLFILFSSGAPTVIYWLVTEIFPIVWKLGLRNQAENKRCCISHILSSNNHQGWYKTSLYGALGKDWLARPDLLPAPNQFMSKTREWIHYL